MSIPQLSLAGISTNELPAAETEFTIWPEMLERVRRWRFWGEGPTAYAWEFRPTSIGCSNLVQHLASGGKFEMTTVEDF